MYLRNCEAEITLFIIASGGHRFPLHRLFISCDPYGVIIKRCFAKWNPDLFCECRIRQNSAAVEKFTVNMFIGLESAKCRVNPCLPLIKYRRTLSPLISLRCVVATSVCRNLPSREDRNFVARREEDFSDHPWRYLRKIPAWDYWFCFSSDCKFATLISSERWVLDESKLYFMFKGRKDSLRDFHFQPRRGRPWKWWHEFRSRSDTAEEWKSYSVSRMTLLTMSHVACDQVGKS